MINETKRAPIGKYISQIYRKGNSFISKEISKFGIGSGQIMFLIELYKNDGISQEELSEILNIDKATTCRAIKKLEKEELLIKVKDENDKRAYKLYLTEKSKSIEDNIKNALNEWEKHISKELSQEEVNILINMLKKICKSKNIK
ncbi:MAG TPA: MarR family transcriptional regulator [Romboutsia timonensis]|uniref:MarR family transcriptional regulator n=1 Tax=Romboutsia timonensis TaxID=1776391 RepID=A0A921N0D9_9FIRM|nr:MarR family transcriptional regulator [uncultured Romboutsia sp.]HJG96647.1 MarR family transcriptional regulator [Romboutsia timonensis]